MKKNLIFFTLFIAFIFVLRLFAISDVDEFSNDISYDVLRQVEEIKESGVPLFSDPFSYGGSSRVFNPLFYYMLLPFSYSNTLFHLQLLLQVLFVISVVLIYLICVQLSLKKRYAYIGATLWAISPISTILNLNSLSPVVILTPLFLLWIYSYVHWIKKQTNLGFFTFAIIQFFLVAIHPLGLLTLLGMLISLFYTKIDHRLIIRKEKELSLFLFSFAIALYYFLYYDALLFHGFSFFIQQTLINTPLDFKTIFALLSQLGLILIPLAVYSLFIFSTINSVTQRFSSRLIGSLGLSITLFFLLQLFTFQVAYYLLTLCSVILVAMILQRFDEKIRKTKFKQSLYKIFWSAIFIMLIAFSISSVYYASGVTKLAPSSELVDVLYFTKQLPSDSLIITPISEVHKTMYYAEKKTLVDSHTLLKGDVEQRKNTVDLAYSSAFLTPVLQNIKSYGFDEENIYVLFTSEDKPGYISANCVTLLYQKLDVSLYQIGCEKT